MDIHDSLGTFLPSASLAIEKSRQWLDWRHVRPSRITEVQYQVPATQPQCPRHSTELIARTEVRSNPSFCTKSLPYR